MGGGGGDTAKAGPTADQIEQQNINAELWDYYQTSYKPLVEKYVSKTTDAGAKDLEAKKIAGQVNADVMRNISPGATDNPVKNVKGLSKLAAFESAAQVQGQGGARSRKMGEIQNIINIGRGQETTATAGLDELASQSISAEISNMSLEQQHRAAIENTYGSVAGAVAAGALRFRKGGIKERPLVTQTTSGRRLSEIEPALVSEAIY